MADSGGTRIIAFVTICIILLSISFSGCFEDGDNSNNYKEECIYDFKLNIQCNSSNYLLNVPIAVYSDDDKNIHISKINDDLELIKGKASFEIEETFLGPSLKINGSLNVEIGYSGTDLNKFLVNNDYSTLFLSMTIDKDKDGHYDDEYGNVQYQIYCHQNITMKITIEFSYYHYDGPGTHLDSYIDIDGEIWQGWNILNGTFETVVE
jgi:hypothetical protein